MSQTTAPKQIRFARFRIPRLPRVTLGTLVFVVLVLAVDFGLIWRMLTHKVVPTSGIVIGLLPLANVLGFGLYRLIRRRGDRHPFTLGFTAVGWPAAVSYGLIFDRYGWSTSWLLPRYVGFVVGVTNFLIGPGGTEQLLTGYFAIGIAVEVLILVVFYSGPPLLLALGGGLVARAVARHREKTKPTIPPWVNSDEQPIFRGLVSQLP